MKPKHNSGALAPKLAQQRGVALIMVLWIFIFLFAVAFEFSTSAREEAGAAHRYSDETQGYYIAMAGFERDDDVLRRPACVQRRAQRLVNFRRLLRAWLSVRSGGRHNQSQCSHANKKEGARINHVWANG